MLSSFIPRLNVGRNDDRACDALLDDMQDSKLRAFLKSPTTTILVSPFSHLGLYS
jgi:hypothetical protein